VGSSGKGGNGADSDNVRPNKVKKFEFKKGKAVLEVSTGKMPLLAKL